MTFEDSSTHFRTCSLILIAFWPQMGVEVFTRNSQLVAIDSSMQGSGGAYCASKNFFNATKLLRPGLQKHPKA